VKNLCAFHVVKHLITECLQFSDENRNYNIPNTLDAVLGPDTDTFTQTLKFLNITKYEYNKIKIIYIIVIYNSYQRHEL